MINQNFIYLAILVSFIGGLGYLIDTVKGKIVPNRVSWFLWALIPLVAFAAQISQNVSFLDASTAFMVGLMPLLIFIGSFLNKKSTWNISTFDFVCGGISLLGIGLWITTKIPNVAIILSLVSDTFASLPTFRKAYKAPFTENYGVFLAGVINTVIVLLALKSFDFKHMAFPLYIFINNEFFVALIVIRRSSLKRE